MNSVWVGVSGVMKIGPCRELTRWQQCGGKSNAGYCSGVSMLTATRASSPETYRSALVRVLDIAPRSMFLEGPQERFQIRVLPELDARVPWYSGISTAFSYG